jgi:iron complex outermembrane receptor protein
MDDRDNLSVRTDWLFAPTDRLSFRLLGQYFTGESNGAGIKGIDDRTPGARNPALAACCKCVLVK